jgi:hypothetical protein
MPTPVNRATFARLQSVHRSQVTRWIAAGMPVMPTGNIDAEAASAWVHLHIDPVARIRAAREHAHKEAAQHRAASQHPTPAGAAVYAGGEGYDHAANLPPEVTTVSVAIESGAGNMARLLAVHLPIDQVRALVDEWVAGERAGWVGAPGSPSPVSDDPDWPEPPIGVDAWSQHELFVGPVLCEVEWQEIIEEAAAASAMPPPDAPRAAAAPSPPAGDQPRRRKAPSASRKAAVAV